MDDFSQGGMNKSNSDEITTLEVFRAQPEPEK